VSDVVARSIQDYHETRARSNWSASGAYEIQLDAQNAVGPQRRVIPGALLPVGRLELNASQLIFDDVQ
jgi:hypothetical protein